MRKFMYFAMVALLLASCSTLGKSGASSSSSQSQTSSSQSLLGSLLGGLVGSAVPLTQKTLIGTWNYSSPDCRFDSESALAKAGGEVAANKVEQNLASLYAQVGLNNCSYTFNEDGTCVLNLGGRNIKGTYTLDTQTRDLKITASAGLLKLNAKVYYNLSELTLLFDTQKLLTAAQVVATITGKASSTIGAISSVLSQYDNMQIGMNLKK